MNSRYIKGGGFLIKKFSPAAGSKGFSYRNIRKPPLLNSRYIKGGAFLTIIHLIYDGWRSDFGVFRAQIIVKLSKNPHKNILCGRTQSVQLAPHYSENTFEIMVSNVFPIEWKLPL